VFYGRVVDPEEGEDFDLREGELVVFHACNIQMAS